MLVVAKGLYARALSTEHGVRVPAFAGTTIEIAASNQPRIACQLPLHLSPVIIPLHRPLPELPASRPLPVATEAPTDILTETVPAGLIPPVTLPPPADERRVPSTVKGTRLVELQLPFWVAKVTFQVPSKAPGLAHASEEADIAATPKTAAANIHRKALMRPKLAKLAIDWADMDMFSLFGWVNHDISVYVAHYGSAVHRCQLGLALP